MRYKQGTASGNGQVVSTTTTPGLKMVFVCIFCSLNGSLSFVRSIYEECDWDSVNLKIKILDLFKPSLCIVIRHVWLGPSGYYFLPLALPQDSSLIVLRTPTMDASLWQAFPQSI
jgi:hypothetical protein